VRALRVLCETARMAQFVIYGHAAALRPRIQPLSDAIHEAAVAALQLPADKRFQRFVPLEPDCFITPPDRSQDYTIVEVSMFEGRSPMAKRRLITELYRTTSAMGLDTNDVEITITETPRANWGIRGVPGDELELPYQVEV
jgi:phenylpyruvate tautomerase PptA (4-oxalocrotonate tautomerase family)